METALPESSIVREITWSEEVLTVIFQNNHVYRFEEISKKEFDELVKDFNDAKLHKFLLECGGREGKNTK